MTSSFKKSVNNEQHLTYHKKGIFIKSAQKAFDRDLADPFFNGSNCSYSYLPRHEHY